MYTKVLGGNPLPEHETKKTGKTTNCTWTKELNFLRLNNIYHEVPIVDNI